jgi:BMFP domain-containing protein YqiC
MLNPNILDEISRRLSELVAATPAKDVEKNARAMLSSLFARLDLVTREEFDVQREVLARARERLAVLESRVSQLEAALGRADPPPSSPPGP